MTAEVFKEYITQILPTATFDESGEWLNVLIDPQNWKPLAQQLRKGEHNFNFLFCLTCIDWKTHLTMVYHLSSTGHRQTIVVKANLDPANPEIETVSDIWRTAEFHEREVYDLFGVKFSNLIPGNYQIDLFRDKYEMINLYKALDGLNNKYGRFLIMRASGIAD